MSKNVERGLLVALLLIQVLIGATLLVRYETRVIAARYGWTPVEARCIRSRDVFSPDCLALASAAYRR